MQSNVVYIFADEAGDMDFSLKGFKYFMFNFLIKKRPFNLHDKISNYKYSLLERNIQSSQNSRLDIESFHAHNDNKYIKNEIFNIISMFDEDSVNVYSYILEKPKVNPIVDYISWAIFRKYERNQDKYYKIIEKYLIDVDVMTKDREVNHYEK